MKTLTVAIHSVTYDTSAGMGTDLFLTPAEADAALFDHLQWYGDGDERTEMQTEAFKEIMLAKAADPENVEAFGEWETWLEKQKEAASLQNDYYTWDLHEMQIPVPDGA